VREFVRRHASWVAPVDGRHYVIVEAVSIDVQPHGIDSSPREEGRSMVRGVFDASASKLGKVAHEHRLVVDLFAALSD